MEIILRPIGDLKNYDKNARTHSDAQVKELAASIKIYGFLDPIEVNKDLVIISGHARLAAALQLGLTHVPTIMHGHLTKTLVKGYTLAANRIAMNAGWDAQILGGELHELKDDGFDLNYTGFTQEEIDAYLNPTILNDGLVDPDECDPIATTDPITRSGDVWLLGTHRLMCGNSTMIDSVDLLMNGEKADMVFTDPPYGINEETDRDFASRTRKCKGNTFDKIIGDETINTAIDSYTLCEGLLIPIMVFWGANYYCRSLPQSGNWLVWDKREEDKQRNTNSDCELAWIKSKANSVRIFRHLWKGMIKGSENGEGRVHPTQKPIALAEWCFNEYGKNAKSVLDLFGGSGSTLIACEKTGRKCYMMELAPNYCDVIIRRWQKFTGKLATLEETGETFNGIEAKSES